MRVYAWCPAYEPTEIPPPPTEQINQYGHITWTPAKCQFAYLDDPEVVVSDEHARIDDHGDTWDAQTRNQFARRLTCTTHHIRPQIFARGWTTDRRWRDRIEDTYEIRQEPAEDHPELLDLVVEHYRTYINLFQWYALRRPHANTLHTYWIQPG